MNASLLVLHRYHNIARKFFSQNGFKHVALLSADGALEAAPAMGSADIILDLVRASICLGSYSHKVHCH